MKDNIKRFIGAGLQGLFGSAGLKLATVLGGGLLLAATADAQPVNDNFVNAVVLSGLSGTISDNNSGATMEAGEASAVMTDDNGSVNVTNSVWYLWTAPQSGNVTFDTIGSVDNNFNGMDTVLGVWTGTNVATLTAIAGDDNAFAGSPTNSKVTFLAAAGTTYAIAIYLSADALGVPGTYVLNWKEQGAPTPGTFSLTSAAYSFSANEDNAPLDPRGLMTGRPARFTVTRSGGADGAVVVNYQASQTIYTNTALTNQYYLETDIVDTDTNNVKLGYTNVYTHIENITLSYENYNTANGFYVRTFPYANIYVYTNSNGFIGRTFVSNGIPYLTNPPAASQYPTFSASTNSDVVTLVTNTLVITNSAGTNFITSFTGALVADPSAASTNGSLTLLASTLEFPDFEMNQDIDVPASAAAQLPNYANALLYLTLTGANLDMLEDPNVLPSPSVGGTTNASMVLLSGNGADLIKGPFEIGGGTNYIYGHQADTNMIVNFERATLACDKTVVASGLAKVYVTLSTIGTASETVYYRMDYAKTSDDNNTFTLQAGSDYARPDNATKYTAANDFTSSSSTLTFTPGGDLQLPINIPITQDNEVKFDRDIQISLYWPPGVQHDPIIGNLGTCDLTILFTTPPAGAVDCFYDPENNGYSSPAYDPEPGANGEVYAAVIQPTDGKAIIGGNFTGYTHDQDSSRYYLARINTDGQLDTTYNSGSGFDAAVEGLALDTNGLAIAVGDFHSFEGNLVNGVARLNADGTLDTSFNPGFGANGSVLAVAIQPDGKILIGGSFTTYNNTNVNNIARLNIDGSLDLTFNAGTGPNGEVKSIAVATNGLIYVGGSFTNVAGLGIQNIVGLNQDGSLNAVFNGGIANGFDAPVHAIVVQPDGNILIAGEFSQLTDVPIGKGIVRVSTNGVVDTTFDVGSGADDVIYSMALQTNGDILIGGIFKSVNQARRISVARLLPNGWVDTGFMDTAYNQFAGLPNYYYNPLVNAPNPVYTIAEQADGGVIIGGNFQLVGGDGGTRDARGTVSNMRNATHARSNVARLIGGSTPGSGNIGLTFNNYSANASSPTFFINITRTNGSLGTVAATFAAIPTGTGPGYASYGVDYTLNSTVPYWGSSYSTPTWMQADGLTGPNNAETAINGTVYFGANNITLNIISNNNANSTLEIGVTQPQFMDTFSLGGENIPLSPALGTSLAQMTIVRKIPHPGTFNFSQAYYSVTENGGSVTLTVTRTGGTDNKVTVNYSTANLTALNGTDYTSRSGILTFNDGTASQTITVPITAGSIARPDRIFTVNLTTPGGGASLGTLTNAQVEIINNNITSGFAEFINGTPISANVMGYGTNETAGAAYLTVARLGGNTGTLTVSVAVTNGTALNGHNFTGLTNTLTWNNADSSLKTIAIPVIDDNVVTSNLTVNVKLANALYNGTTTSNLFGPFTNAVLTVSNVDSAGTVEFTAASYNVNENAGYAIIPVIRTGGSTGPLTVGYSNIDGTATAAANYRALSGILSFAPGQVSTNFIVAITNLSTSSLSPLNFFLVLTNANPTNSLGAPNMAQVSINGSLAFNNPPGQPDGSGNFTGSFNGPVLSLALQSDGKLVAGGSFTQADGVPRSRLARLTTAGALDLTFSTSQPGSGANDSVNAVLYQTNGLIVVAGLFTNFNNTTLKHIARVNVNGSLDSSFIPGAGTDNPIFALAQNNVAGQRRILIGGSFTLYNGVARNGIAQLTDTGGLDTGFAPISGANGSVYAIAVQPDGKILVGGDFTTFNGVPSPYLARLNPDGSVDSTFNVGTGPDSSVRALSVQADGRILAGGVFTNFNGSVAGHLVRLNAGGSLDSTFVLGAGANGNVYTIAVQPDTRIVVGGDFGLFNGVTRNRITRLNPDGTTDVSINFGFGADGTVLSAVLQPDGKIDLGGSFANYNNVPHVGIVRINGGSLAGSGLFQFASANYSVDERGTNVLISVIRTGGTAGTNSDGSGTIIIPFATSDITAKADTDHAGVTNYIAVKLNLAFPPGEVLQTVSVPVLDDNLITSNLTVQLAITNGPAAYLGGQSLAILTIINDDSAINFASATYSAPKNVINGVALVGIQRFGGITGTSTVTFLTTMTGNAVPTTDYTPVGPVTVTFAPGVTNVLADIPINNNGLAEGNRTVGLQLTNAIGSALYNPSNAVLTIIDTITAPGSLSFATSNFTVNANSGSATLTVIRTAGSSGTVTANYSTTPGTASPGVNYTTTSGTVTFNDGQTNATFTVPILNNNLAIGPVYLTVSLSNPTGGALLTAPTNATLNIVNTNVVVAFAQATNTFAETAGTAPITVTRFNNTATISTVNYATSDGSAVANVNYLAASGTVTFNAGETTKVIPVTLIHNTNYTGTVAFNVTLSNPGAGVQIGVPNPTVVQITDVEAGISLTNSTLSVNKNAGSLIVTVVCLNTNVEPVIVDSNTVPLSVGFATQDGTALSGVDYTGVSGTLVFTNGLATNTFTVPIINNGLVGGNKTFSVVLKNPTAPGVLVPPSSAVVTIFDSNAGLSFSSSTYSVNKSGVAATITVLRTDNTNLTSTVNFVATNGTAVSGLNFISTNGTLIFTNGVTSRSFVVPIISTTVGQPDLTVLLQLKNPTNGVLVPPSAATLTIHDDTGSFVVPAGSMLTSESGAGAPNGIIDINETVTLQFAFRVAGGTNVQNLIAKIITNANVTASSPVTNSYGPLAYLGHSVSRPFTFTAKGTNNQPITANFNLYDVNTNNPIGTAVFGYIMGSVTSSFTNSTTIVIRDNTNASPYPAVINVSGVGGTLIKATVTLNKFYHTSPSDVDALAVSPSGLDTLVMAHVGGQVTVTNVILTFDDAATNIMTSGTPAVTGTNKPSVVLPVSNFP